MPRQIFGWCIVIGVDLLKKKVLQFCLLFYLGPQYSPGNATPIPTLSPRNPFYSPVAAPAQDISPVPSPSLQGAEVSGNTTPHPGLEDSPHHLQSIASSVPRY